MVSVGDIIEGTVTGVRPFGAFVDLGENTSGLIHISEISAAYVENINEHIKKGDKVRVMVLRIDDKGKISLSLKRTGQNRNKKKAEQMPRENIRPDDFDWNRKDNAPMSFEDKLSRFKKISDENMQAIRRSAESKRSGGYSRRNHY